MKTRKENKGKLFNLIPRHFTPEIEAKMESMDNWTETKAIQGSMELLGTMQKSCHQCNDAKQIVMTVVKSEKDLLLLYQNPGVSNRDHPQGFKALVDVISRRNGRSSPRPNRGGDKRYFY